MLCIMSRVPAKSHAFHRLQCKYVLLIGRSFFSCLETHSVGNGVVLFFIVEMCAYSRLSCLFYFLMYMYA